MQVIARGADGVVAGVADGGDVPLVEPPQGGQVLFIGVRATNLDGCSLSVRASLRDAASGATLATDERFVDLVTQGDGWGAPPAGAPITSFANVPVCPNTTASREVDGSAWVLAVTVQDREQRTATVSMTVTPRCADALCTEECKL
jgi:hypothetical protein